MRIAEQKRVEEELHLSGELLRLVLDSAQIGIWDWDLRTGELVWSPRCLEMFGIPRNTSMTYERFMQALHPEDRHRIDAAVKDALDNRDTYEAEMRAVWPDGSVHWVGSRGRVYFDEQARPVRMSGAAFDLSRLKRTEQELSLASERFEVALRGTPITVFHQDLDLRYTWVHNPVGPHIAVQIVGKFDRDLLERAEDIETIVGIKREVLRTGISYQGEICAQFGGEIRHYAVNLDPQRDSEGKIAGLTGASVEITDRKRADEVLRVQRERSEFVADASDVGFWFCDLPFDKLVWDRRVKNHFWLPADAEVTIDIFYERLHPDDRDRTRASIDESIGNHTRYDIEYRTVSPQGAGEKWIRAIGRTFYDPEGHPRRFDGVTVDVTDRKRAEAALRESEAAFRELAENLDLAVQSRTQELQERNRQVLQTSEELRVLSARVLQIQDEERRRIARELHDSAGQLLVGLALELSNLAQESDKSAPQLRKLVDDSLELVKELEREIRTQSYLLHPPLLDEAGLFSALTWYAQGLAKRSGIEVRLDVPNSLGRLPVHLELPIFRLVQESLSNIHRHSGSKTANIRIARNCEAVTVEVQDEGKGMTPSELRRIREGGSGVGIRGMRERLRQFGGDLRIESSPLGTAVKATIPLPRDSASEKMGPVESLRAAQ